MAIKAPYPPKTASIGGVPTVSVDVPISAVFLFLFILGAVGHMFILQTNLRKGHKFIMSGLMFGFCMVRNVTCIMRIVWACYPHDVKVAIAAMIFVNAGVLILLLINVVFAQRVVRAAHPHFGWHRAFHWTFIGLYVLILLMLAVIITATVQSFYTLNPNTHRIDRDLQRTTGTYFMFISFLPLLMVIVGLIIPRKTHVQKFGSGRWRTKIWILLTTTTLLCLGAAFRCGTQWKNLRPINDPAWYDNKWCFYFFNFTMEIIVVYLYILLRVDRRFHIPDGSKGPGDYVRDDGGEQEKKAESTHSVRRILSEEEVFDDEEAEDGHLQKDLEANGRTESR
jgi:uncharacterized membrane protein YedE/YeeE